MNNNLLESLVQRIERLEDEKAVICIDIKDVYLEAKSNGFDVKILRKIISMRKQDPHARETEQALIGTYMQALETLDDTPLGMAALEGEKANAAS